ncbi:protein COFACTOR ASSEMBLY OF COMPLEX C SUBUNIT B CCB3, chloroplastic [Iris pallida]|uniref:Protein COFACTOR ASSEMBLY OF COMPLEX C SUBUNIT B CCB3, chloroplastic n=1 Tax=Iris pallida TaxID=29817 RepID=A0AAX6HAS4_IRIPA|nr:protein COFACTOR ASSEMBLY OF COMPLEX C SUBUNIT B CCB3, chloroplastic [Iris pallida]KAJ6830206.1 protein COFACTOR ASSEMBLY OF COMPLEX C SUBUNIT B CCB3, chloroplastic [Iris pallida]KAJ6837794.1 protein COFACTOR ASSEMBLY OF COMPLEX C SUBUNIT B CCB3, chloroplastic [Iris pallida]KAJ6837795.1 protein COFACTOR ASSEMBLY OF COMPLEX C SUBUNIT B CCB3, chloroplastic [Iris pallida]
MVSSVLGISSSFQTLYLPFSDKNHFSSLKKRSSATTKATAICISSRRLCLPSSAIVTPNLVPSREESMGLGRLGKTCGATHLFLTKDTDSIPARRQLQIVKVACFLRPTSLDVSVGRAGATTIRTLAASKSESLHIAVSDCIEGLVIADLDPATAKTAIGIMGPFLSAFGFLFIIRIVMSWYPKLPVGKFPYIIAYAPTEPILRVTRKLIPPLGGVDVTPVVWFGLISFLNEILVGPQGLLVLLSQHV